MITFEKKSKYGEFNDTLGLSVDTGDKWLDKKLNSTLCYGKGGGGGSQQQDVPATLRPYVTKVLDRASDLYAAERPYQAYPGERVVGFSQPELAAQQGIAQQVLQRGMGATAPGLTSAGAFYNPAYGLLGQATGAQQMGGAMLGQVAPALGQAQQTLGGVQPALGMYGQSVGQAQQALGATAPTLGQFEQQLQQASGTYGQAAEAARAATGPVDIGQLETQRFMDPYQQQVTDIAKREAVKESQLYGQQLAAQAAQTGGFGGSRQALLEGQAASDLGGRLADIQAKGSQAAYQQALQTAAQQQQLGYGERTAELQRQAGLSQALAGLGGSQAALGIQGYGGLAGAGRETAGQMAQLGSQYGQIGSQLGQLAGLQADIGGQYGGLAGQYGQQAAGLGGLSQAYGGLGQQALGQQYRELGYLSGVGEAQRGLEQQRADTAYQEFLQQRDYPSQQLQQFSSLIQGFPFQISQPTAAPSALQQGLGTAATIGGIGRGLGFFKEGGQIDDKKNSGLSGVVYKQEGGRPITSTLERFFTRGGTTLEEQTLNKKAKTLSDLIAVGADTTAAQREYERAAANLKQAQSIQSRLEKGTEVNKENKLKRIESFLENKSTPQNIREILTEKKEDILSSSVPSTETSTPAPEGFTGETPMPVQLPEAVKSEVKTKGEKKQVDDLQRLLDEAYKFDREAKEKAIKSQQGFDIAALGMQLMSKPLNEIDSRLISQLGVSQKELAGLSEQEAKNKLQKKLTSLAIKQSEADIKKTEAEAELSGQGIYLDPFLSGQLKQILEDTGANQMLINSKMVTEMANKQKEISEKIQEMGIIDEGRAKQIRMDALNDYAMVLLGLKEEEQVKENKPKTTAGSIKD